LDGVSPQADDTLGAHNRGSKLSGYIGGSATSRYRQVNIGYGRRSDFTLENVDDKGEAKYDFEKFGSFKYSLETSLNKTTKKKDTFYSSYKKYEKVYIPTGLSQNLGRGVSNHNGLGHD